MIEVRDEQGRAYADIDETCYKAAILRNRTIIDAVSLPDGSTYFETDRGMFKMTVDHLQESEYGDVTIKKLVEVKE